MIALEMDFCAAAVLSVAQDGVNFQNISITVNHIMGLSNCQLCKKYYLSRLTNVYGLHYLFYSTNFTYFLI